jgi:hypothetical protein
MKTKLMPLLLMFALTLYGAASIGTRGYAGPPSTSSANHENSPHFVPNSQEFWDFSKNWTTYYGPAYRDTVLERSEFLPCTGGNVVRKSPLPSVYASENKDVTP